MASTYAIGDLHGELTLLKQLLEMLPYKEEDTLVFLGDYVDRGEDSAGTVRALRDLQRVHARTIFLRGNHEDAWLNRWNGISFSRPPHVQGALEFWDQCNGHIPFEVGDWLDQTRIEYEDEHAYYVHAGVLPGKPFHRTSDFYKMWGPPQFLESNYDWGKTVVCGHWNEGEPLVLSNKICVDTGAYETGILTAIRLPDRQLFQAQLELPESEEAVS